MVHRARVYAARLLRYRVRSTYELRQRLTRHGYPAAAVEMVVQELTTQGAVDDRQFARLWVAARVRAHRGSWLIARELTQQFGIAPALVADVLQPLASGPAELMRARAFVERRAPRYARTPRETQWRRLSQQLARRGFSADIIDETLHACLKHR